MAFVSSHCQCLDAQRSTHVIVHGPADDHAGAQVDDGGQVQPALAGTQVRYVAD